MSRKTVPTATQPPPVQAGWEDAFSTLASATKQTWIQKEDIAAAFTLPTMHVLANNQYGRKGGFPLQDVGLGFANQVVARNLVERVLLPNCSNAQAATSLVAGSLLSLEQEVFGWHKPPTGGATAWAELQLGKQRFNTFAEGVVASSLASLAAALPCQAAIASQAEQQKKQEQLDTSQQLRR